MHKKHIIAGLTAAALLVPVAALAQTSVEAQAKSLMAQIQALQLQLKTLMETNGTAGIKVEKQQMAPGQMAKAKCVMIKRDLRVGAQGDDVKQLQEMLAEDPETGFSGKATGFYGPLTANAMAKFQARAGIAAKSDGTVGEMTRGFFERECGKGPEKEMPRAETVAGTITVSANSSITVQMKDGNTRIVNVMASTSIQVLPLNGTGPSLGTVADLTVGKKIQAQGAPQADGSLTARQVRVGVKEQ